MPLNATQLNQLKTADQRFRAHVAVFAAYTPTITPPAVSGSGTLLAPKPIPRCAPRYQVCAHSATVALYGRDSFNRGGGYVGNANITFALDAGSSGSVSDNGDGTATYTAPANGTGVAQINIAVTNSNGSKTGHAFVAYPKTTYDEMVAEIATISGSLSQHGWKMTLRVRGAATDFVVGKRILLHIEDTWDTTTATFGGYQYAEGVMMGYITESEYFEDWAGDSWLGLEVQSPWWMLGRMPVGELWWGDSPEAGKFYLAGFTPVDAIWHFVNEITDFTKHHDVVLWFDQNSIDDFITEESDLATLFDDIMKRTLSLSYCDRYGNLFCVPDPDVRADEYWGTPTSTYTLTPDYVMSYGIKRQPYEVRKLTLAAFDRSKMGMWAVSENPTALGANEAIRGLLCDAGTALASWAVQKRAAMNRQWVIEATHPLNHVLDLNNFVDAIFTAPSQSGALTASGQVYTDSISYRPDVANGGWIGSIRYLQRTEGVGEAETGAVSGWGGTGQYWTGGQQWTSTALFGSGVGGWVDPEQGQSAWCYLFDFTQSNGGFVAQNETNSSLFAGGYEGTRGAHVAAGWQTTTVVNPSPVITGRLVEIRRGFSQRALTRVQFWYSGSGNANNDSVVVGADFDTAVSLSAISITTNPESGTLSWTGVQSATSLHFFIGFNLFDAPGAVTSYTHTIVSALVRGVGSNPFGSGNCA